MKKLLFLPFILLSIIIQSQIIKVPQDYLTIQRGINAALDGDTVLIDTGIYYERINFNGKAITVASHYILHKNDYYIKNTVINGNYRNTRDSSYVVYFTSNEDSTSVLEGFTIVYGSVRSVKTRLLEGGAAYIYNASPKLINNQFIGEKFIGRYGRPSRTYVTWMYLTEKNSLVKGSIYRVEDSSIVVLPNTYLKQGFTSNATKSIFNYTQIDNVYIRNKKSPWIGLVIGAVSGMAIGVASGFIAGDDPPCDDPFFCVPVSAEAKAIMIGVPAAVIGAGIGLIIGSLKVKIPINGKAKNFDMKKSQLERYSIR